MIRVSTSFTNYSFQKCMAEGDQNNTGKGTIGLILQDDQGKLYMSTSSHVVKSAQGSFSYKTTTNEIIEIAKLTKLPPTTVTDEHLDTAEIVEVTNCKFGFKTGYPNTEDTRCKARISSLTLEQMLRKKVYHISIDGDKRSIIKGEVVDIEKAGDDHYFVVGFGNERFATKGNSGGIVAMETEEKGEVELVGMITSGDYNFHRSEDCEERRYGRCLILNKAIEHLEKKYGRSFCLNRQVSGPAKLESGMIIYFQV